MKILIVSDTHGRHEILRWILRDEKPIDRLLHLGDSEGGEKVIEEMAECPCDFVAGNCDMFTKLPRSKVVEIGKYRILMTHGHNQGVSYTEEHLIESAKEIPVDIVMYGHTHVPVLHQDPELTVLNPGSLTYPRQLDRRPSYIVMTIDDKGKADFAIRYYGKK